MSNENIIKNLEKENTRMKSEIAKLEKNSKRTERLAALGYLSAGILHEIRNPLNFVNTFSKISGELIEETKEIMSQVAAIAPAEQQELLEEVQELINMLEGNITKIHDNGMRAQRIINGMLGQTRESDSSPFEKVDINQLLEEFTKLSYHAMRGEDNTFNCRFNFNFAPNLPKINLSSNDIIRVVINLVNNAIYALNEKRKIVTDFEAILSVSTHETEDGQLEIRFRDNGIGMSPEVLKKLFNSFFTTKPTGKGTGLGLSLSKEIIIKAHKGTIRAVSSLHEYSEFIITIPMNLER